MAEAAPVPYAGTASRALLPTALNKPPEKEATVKISDQLPGVPLERRSPLGRPIVAALVQIACIGWVALMVYLTITSMAGVFR